MSEAGHFIDGLENRFRHAFPTYVQPNEHYGLHAHSYHELVLVQTGKYRARVGDREHVASAGDVLFYRACVPHEEWAEEGGVVVWDCAFYWKPLDVAEFIFRKDISGKIQDLLAQLTTYHSLYIVAGRKEPHHKECTTFLKRLIDELVETSPHARQAIVDKARKYIFERINEPLAIQELADHVGLSRAQFFRTYQAITGRTPWNDVQFIRMQEAKRLITTTNLPLHQIAPKVGISTEYHLSRLLKTLLGVGVKDLRR